MTGPAPEIPDAVAAELAEALADLVVRAIQAEAKEENTAYPPPGNRDTIAASSTTIPRRQQ